MRPTLSSHAALSISALLSLAVVGTACGSPTTPPAGTGGAAQGTGGAAQGTGGAAQGTGGTPPGTGGAPQGTGGTPPGTGGAPQGTGGGASGGAPASGGGGNVVNGEWGMVENPGAGCTVPAMPSVDSLPEDPKLPDPFEKMDGTRITDKSEWVCRREEIRQQALAFIYGDKPVPEEVSGTVSASSITVDVSDGGGSTSFSVTVNMNGATAPAPAMILYSASAPIPSGVARITFQAIEPEGGSGPKTGPFFDVYGSDSPTGYSAAQAWQVSRILDVLEQNPGTIDPYRIGVTGCSRNGKGAFVAGVLDNRIALTVPIESGLGGTVGLRLVQVLDPGAESPPEAKTEWPYHGISYVRWMSEVRLGQFTTANFDAAADQTEKLPIDMHEMIGLIAPRGLLIADNPSTTYNGLDRYSAWVTANAGRTIFDALGVGDHFTYQGAGGSHCDTQNFRYSAALTANINRFLLGDESATTGTFTTDLAGQPVPEDHYDWTVPTLTGEL